MLPYTEYLIGMILCNYITFPHIPYDSPTLRHMALQLVILGNDADVSVPGRRMAQLSTYTCWEFCGQIQPSFQGSISGSKIWGG